MKIKNTKKSATAKVVAKKSAKCATKCATKTAAKKSVMFTLHAEKGKTVCLAGEFNGWDPSAKKLSYKARQGLYMTTLKLEAGTYQYKFVVDGAWCADPENVNCVPNDQGTFNSVITVK